MMSAQLFGIIFTLVGTFIGDNKGYTVVLWAFTSCIFLSCVLLYFFKEDYKRMQAEKKKTPHVIAVAENATHLEDIERATDGK
jgi:hypothetical protein